MQLVTRVIRERGHREGFQGAAGDPVPADGLRNLGKVLAVKVFAMIVDDVEDSCLIVDSGKEGLREGVDARDIDAGLSVETQRAADVAGYRVCEDVCDSVVVRVSEALRQGELKGLDEGAFGHDSRGRLVVCDFQVSNMYAEHGRMHTSSMLLVLLLRLGLLDSAVCLGLLAFPGSGCLRPPMPGFLCFPVLWGGDIGLRLCNVRKSCLEIGLQIEEGRHVVCLKDFSVLL